ncbi:unnamed protein product [Lymnaea stagnalis]|uniref:Uncharacterized protein n=1 Tax=Lymnaea stagnalis TaxID=6523 RepID=A0AAV2HLY0_LYMST
MATNYAMFIFSALIYCHSTQKITIKDFSYKHSNKSCTNVLINDIDVVEFTCLVDYSEAPDVNYVIFQTKKTNETRFIFLTDCNIQEGCKDSQTAHGRQIGKDTIEITVRVIAKSSLSGAKLRGLLYTPDNKATTSSEVIFPNIKDLNDAEGKLIINGNTITQSTQCQEVITRPELNVLFVCESQVLPCLIEISTDGSIKRCQGRGNCTWNKDYPSQSEVYVLIKYAVCNLNGISKSVSCRLNFEYNSTANENDGSNNPIRSGLYIIAVMMVIILCL